MIALLALLILKKGAMSAAQSVTFENPDPCAVKGSSVVFRCSYDYKDGDTVTETAWYKGALRGGQWKRVLLSDFPSFQNRTEYLGDLEHNCSLAIRDVQENDTGYYFIRFDTKTYGWRSKKSVHLSVTELNARVSPRVVRAGDSVTLECETSCQDSSIIWFKDGRPIAKSEFQAQAEDSGNYVCSLHGQESLQSDPVALDVQYDPVNISVAVDPPLVVGGSSVNLTCSSDANPAANYTWFRGSASGFSSMDQVGSGQLLSIPSMEVSHNGLYLCQASNQLGENNSTGVLLTVYNDNAPENVTLSMSPPGDIIRGGSVTFTCSSDASPPVTQSGYSLYKDGHFISSGQSHFISDIQPSHRGLYYCQAWNNVSRRGFDFFNSTEVLLDVQYGPVNISVAVDPPLVVGGSSVNLTCNSDANPAANYTWFRGSASSFSSMDQVGSGQLLSIPSMDLSHNGLYLCQASNQLGENNSTGVLLTVDDTEINRLILLLGIGVKIVIVLLLTMVIIWAWRRCRRSAEDREENVQDYENIQGLKEMSL